MTVLLFIFCIPKCKASAKICIFACPGKTCPYGYVPAGCPRCQCAPNPCLFTKCPSGFSCKPIPQRCPHFQETCPHRAHCVSDVSKGEQPCGCTDEFKPVCATNFIDGTVNFANECNMRCSLLHYIKFEDGFCHCDCPDYYDPVCGVDQNGEVSFVNNCWRSCNGVPLQHEGMCDCNCPVTEKPVCGNDGQTYINECIMGCVGVTKVKNSAC
ncbi:serine protease inhibitor dipetalogastin-like [Mytilus californianus]|uniref:serine protease inhibitor dipetalogastin-like n=1 Tax=Mytilus californianus TaxID=6549 RepID=UPI002245CD98|nr:serine protease inhibitor dipetalogastin-like [Mytilus californianus]